MSGRYSRNKGLRNEYLVRDMLRAEGFTADRVPSSGAAEGFKGDVKCSKDGRSLLVEVKVRAGTSFKPLYEFYAANEISGRAAFSISTGGKLWCVDVANSLSTVLAGTDYPVSNSKGAQQAIKLFPMLKESDILVVRNDHKPFLFLRYR